MNNFPVITGVGVISPLGNDKKTFWNNLLQKKSGIQDIQKFDTSPYPYKKAGEVKGFRLKDYISGARFRRAANISKFAIAAVKQALDDARLFEFDRTKTALTVGVTHGAINLTRDFHKGLLKGEGASPMLFSDSVLNAPAGNISLCFDIRGAVHTLIGSASAAISAASLACDLLRTHRVDKVIVCCSEELDELIYHTYSRLKYASMCNKEVWSPFNKKRIGSVMGEGASAIVLERRDDAYKRGVAPYGEVLAVQRAFYRKNGPEIIKKTMQSVLAEGAENSNLADFISVASNGQPEDRFEASALRDIFKETSSMPHLGTIRANLGEAFSATGLFQIITSCLMMKNNIIFPDSSMGSLHEDWQKMPIASEAMEKEIKSVLVNSKGIDGFWGSLFLKSS